MGYLVSDRPTEFTGIGPLPGWLISRRTENARFPVAPRRPRRRASSCLVVLLVGKQQRDSLGGCPRATACRASHQALQPPTGTVKDTFINRLTSMRTGNRSLLVFSLVCCSLLTASSTPRCEPNLLAALIRFHREPIFTPHATRFDRVLPIFSHSFFLIFYFLFSLTR